MQAAAREQQSKTSDHESTNQRVAVVVLHYSGLDDTLKCLESLRRLEYNRHRVIVVDNGSSPPVGESVAAAHPWVEVIRQESNGGWAGGNNAGIRRALDAGADQIVLLNNDTVVAPELITRLIRGGDHSPDFGILGPVVCYMDEPDRVNVDGCVFRDSNGGGFFLRQPIPLDDGDPPQVTETEIINGCCMMVRADVFERIGMIDERFFLIHEESEFCLRARQAGFRCGVVGQVLVWHKGSSAFQRESRPLQRYFDARNLYLVLKTHRRSYGGGQSLRNAWTAYLKHVYYMYSVQRELGNDAAADAVLQGFCDALAGRYGPPRTGHRWLLPVVRSAAGLLAWSRGGR